MAYVQVFGRRARRFRDGDLNENLSKIPNELYKNICNFLFEHDTCPSKEMEKHIVRYYEIRQKRGEREWSAPEGSQLNTIRFNLKNILDMENHHYHHTDLKISYLNIIEMCFQITEVLVETHEERQLIWKN